MDRATSRRDFLRNSSVALAGRAALPAVGIGVPAGPRESRASSPAPPPPAAGRQAVACTRREAAEAARRVLERGGNAVDAAVAALLVQFVIEPAMTGLGGYGGSMVYYEAKSGRVRVIDSTSRAPRKFDVTKFSAATARHGYLAVGVPGNVAGLDCALRKYGTRTFQELAAPAIELAENGISVTSSLERQFAGLVADIDPVSHRAHFPDGVPRPGELWRQRDLARLLRRLGADGPQSFYSGEIAAAICKQVREHGGALAEEDFREFRPTTTEPLHISYRDFDLYTPTLPSGGLTCLSILKTLEQFDLSPEEPWSAAYYNLFVDAANLAWREREQYFGDPEFVTVPVDDLLAAERARRNAATVRNGVPAREARPPEASHTVNVVVVDKQQNVVSWTSTHGEDFGAHVAIEGYGLMLGHGISRFSLDKSSPNFPAGGKRPQHNMVPLVILRHGRPLAALGVVGGTRIVSVTTQMVVNLVDFQARPQQIVSSPRIHTEGGDPVQVSEDMPREIVEAVRSKGHVVRLLQPLGGSANAAVIDPQTGSVLAAASRTEQGVIVF